MTVASDILARARLVVATVTVTDLTRIRTALTTTTEDSTVVNEAAAIAAGEIQSYFGTITDADDDYQRLISDGARLMVLELATMWNLGMSEDGRAAIRDIYRRWDKLVKNRAAEASGDPTAGTDRDFTDIDKAYPTSTWDSEYST